MHAIFSTVHGHTARIAHEITSFSRSLTFMIIDQKCITLAHNSKLARVTVSLCMYIQLERAPMIHWPVFQPTFIHFPISRLAKTRPCLLRTKLGANFSTSSQQEDAASRTTSLDLSTPRNLQFEILNEPPPLDPPSNGRNPTRKGRKLERAMGARVIVDSNLCEFLFFFLLLFLSTVKSPCARSKEDSLVVSILGRERVPTLNLCKYGIRGWKVAPIDSNFSSFFVKIIPRTAGTVGRKETVSKESFSNVVRMANRIAD